MIKAITYLGPDDVGIYINERNGIALGHVRFSILDLSPLGHQPMESFNGRYVVVFNDGISNYRELKDSVGRNDYNTAKENFNYANYSKKIYKFLLK